MDAPAATRQTQGLKMMAYSSPGNTTFLPGLILMGLVKTATSFQVMAMTLNQGVERFIGDSDQQNSGGFSFRANVPELANRDTKVHVFVKIAGMSAPTDNWAVECKLTVHRAGGDKTYDADGTTAVPTGTGFTYKAILLPRRDAGGNAINEPKFLAHSWLAELQFTIPADDMTTDINSMQVSVGKRARAVMRSGGGNTLGQMMNWEVTKNAPATVTQSPAVIFHIVPFTYTYKDVNGNTQSKSLNTSVVQSAMRSRLLAYLPISQNSLTVDVLPVTQYPGISWDEAQHSGKTLNDPGVPGGPSAFEDLILNNVSQTIQKAKNVFYIIPIPRLIGRSDSLVLGGTPDHEGGTKFGTHNSLMLLNEDGSEVQPRKIISVHELLHAHDVHHIDGHSGEASPFEAFPTVAPYTLTVNNSSGSSVTAYGMIGVAAFDPVMSVNFDLMTNNSNGKVQWISDYTYAKASQYQLGSQGLAPLTSLQTEFYAPAQEDKMKIPATAQALMATAILSTPSQAQIEGARFVRTGLVSMNGTYSPDTGLMVSSSVHYAAYRMTSPTDKPAPGSKGDLERWKRYSEEIQDPLELTKGYTLEIISEGQRSFRVRTDTGPMWRPGQISWLCWVPERITVKSIRLFKDGAFLGEAQPKDSGFVPEVDLLCDAGRLTWRAPVKAQVVQVVGSDDGGKTWRIYGHGQEKSIPVDLSGAFQWVFAIECVNQDDGKFFRKEIQVKP